MQILYSTTTRQRKRQGHSRGQYQSCSTQRRKVTHIQRPFVEAQKALVPEASSALIRAQYRHISPKNWSEHRVQVTVTRVAISPSISLLNLPIPSCTVHTTRITQEKTVQRLICHLQAPHQLEPQTSSSWHLTSPQPLTPSNQSSATG